MPAPLAALAAPAVAGAIAMGVFAGLAQPLFREITFLGNSLHPNEHPDPSTLINMRWRGKLSEDEYNTLMQDLGYNKTLAMRMYEAASQLIGPIELITAKRRGEIISDEEYSAIMKKNRITERDAEILEKLTLHYPNVQDLIRFAVREVYNEDAAKKNQADMDFEKLPFEQFEKGGISKDILKLYWRAHWELPGIGQALEMWQRLRPVFNGKLVNPDGTIEEISLDNPEITSDIAVDDKTIDDFLKYADVMPFWIPRIKQLSFNLPTRVDIRRMRELGLLTPQQVEILYNQLGYSPGHARLLTQVAERMATDEPKMLTKDMILDALYYGEIKEEDAYEFLERIGYVRKDAELIVTIDRKNREEKELTQKINTLKSQYVKGVIAEDKLKLELDALGIAASRRDVVVEQANTEKLKAMKLLSKDDLKDLVKKGVIDADYARTVMLASGYMEHDVDALLELWGGEAA